MNERVIPKVTSDAAGHNARSEAAQQSGTQAEIAALLPSHIGTLCKAARRALPKTIFDYLDGGSFEEHTLRANLTDLSALKLRQCAFSGAATRCQATTLAGLRVTMPVALAPVGLAGIFRPQGEIKAARAAKAFGVPYCLSTLAGCAIEDLAAAIQAPFLFQLYLFKDRAINETLLARAQAAGCPAVVLTVDTAVQGRRNRDYDNQLIVPLKVRPRHIIDIAMQPRWLIGYLSNKPTLANLVMFARGNTELAEASIWAERNFKGAVGIDDLAWVRARWKGKLIVKGILNPEDAKLAVAHGADAIVVSNHGGRQLDSARSTARAFPAIREAVGDHVELLFDSGVRSGLDILKALGLGARGCLIGRAYLYGLAARGEAGVTAALQILSQELDAGMALTGVEDVTAIPDGLLIRD